MRSIVYIVYRHISSQTMDNSPFECQTQPKWTWRRKKRQLDIYSHIQMRTNGIVRSYSRSGCGMGEWLRCRAFCASEFPCDFNENVCLLRHWRSYHRSMWAKWLTTVLLLHLQLTTRRWRQNVLGPSATYDTHRSAQVYALNCDIANDCIQR